MKRVLYTIWQILWGLPQTLVGAMVFLVFRPHRHDWFHGVLVSSWPYRSCVSLGMFVFIADSAIGHADSLANPERPSLQRIIAHEYGHTVQSALFGPLYLPIMGLPSALWANLRAASRWRSAQERSYYDFPTERFANYLETAFWEWTRRNSAAGMPPQLQVFFDGGMLYAVGSMLVR